MPVKSEVKFAQSCPTLWDCMDCSLPGSSVRGILQVGVLGWVAILFSSGSSWPRYQTQVLCIAGSFFTVWATGEALAPGLLGLEKLPGCLCVNSERYFPTASPWLICLCPRCLWCCRLLWLGDYSDTHSGTVGIGLGQRRERISGQILHLLKCCRIENSTLWSALVFSHLNASQTARPHVTLGRNQCSPFLKNKQDSPSVMLRVIIA